MKLGVLISGRGSNLQALIEACAGADFPAELALVVSNRPEAAGLAHAAAAGVATRVIDHTGFGDRESFDAALDAELRAAGVELVCLAGFMRLLSAGFVDGWRDRIVNIHPSLLPAFKGVDAHAQALAAGVRISGCTVHFVVPEMDAGPIIVQAAVPVLPGDGEAQLAARILEAEHVCYPWAVRLIAEGRVRVQGARVKVDAEPWAGPPVVNPASSR